MAFFFEFLKLEWSVLEGHERKFPQWIYLFFIIFGDGGLLKFSQSVLKIGSQL